jgi:uncharacterized protein YbcI
MCKPLARADDRIAGTCEFLMKTREEIEAGISEAIIRYEQEHMGRGAKKIHTHLIGNHIVVILEGVLTSAERHLVQSLSPERGRVLLKQERELLETGRPILVEMLHEVTGVKVLSMHHDISTVTGEKVIAFTLANAPQIRQTK